MEKELKQKQGINYVREDGILRIGTKLVISPEIIGFPEVEREKEYRVTNVEKIIKLDSPKPIYYITLDGLGERVYTDGIFSIVPTNFNVYRWKGYYILALSEEQAQRIWNTWIDNLEIVAADGRPKMYKFVNNLQNRGDQELFPRIIRRLHSEYSFPCIVEDLEFEKEPVYVYKFPG